MKARRPQTSGFFFTGKQQCDLLAAHTFNADSTCLTAILESINALKEKKTPFKAVWVNNDPKLLISLKAIRTGVSIINDGSGPKVRASHQPSPDE